MDDLIEDFKLLIEKYPSMSLIAHNIGDNMGETEANSILYTFLVLNAENVFLRREVEKLRMNVNNLASIIGEKL